MNLMPLTVNNFDRVAKSADTVVMFSLSSCAPCHEIRRRLEKLSDGAENIQFVKVEGNDQEAVPLFHDYGVRQVPTLLALRNGKVVGKLIGPHKSMDMAHWIGEAFAPEED